MQILPACGNSSDDSSNDVIISFSEEARIRCWSHIFEANKKSRIAEVDTIVSKIDVNEALSDTDDDRFTYI
jgi:hypothetical protein